MAKNSYKSTETKEEKKPIVPKLNFFSDRRLQLFVGFTLLFVAFFLLVSFISYLKTGQVDQSVVKAYTDTNTKESGLEVRNSFGLMGAISSYYFIFLWFGIAAFLIPPFLFLVGYRVIWHRNLLPMLRSFNFVVFYLIWISLLMGYILLMQEKSTFLSFISGGIGYELAMVLYSLLGWGAAIFIAFLFIIFNMFFFNITKISSLEKLENGFFESLGNFISLFKIKKKEKPEVEEEIEEEDISSVLQQVKQEVENEENVSQKGTETWIVKKIPIPKRKKAPISKPDLIVNETSENNVEKTPETPHPTPSNHFQTPSSPTPPSTHEESGLAKDIEDKIFTSPNSVSNEPPQVDKSISFDMDFDAPAKKRTAVPPEDLSLEVEETPEPEEKVVIEEAVNYDPTLDLPRYEFPTASLLTEYPPKDVQVSKGELEQNKDKIVETLINFKIGISSIKATIGPTVTLYEIVPEAGVKISKIKNLEDDIALSLAALGIRIIAPIPGKGTIGIEVPNKNREMVDIKSVITMPKFMESDRELPIVLGKTISNDVFVTDLAKMPHLLMAGATGQGKSVGLNVILTSLLYKKHPSQLKLVLVDPKKVELTLFNKIEQHFLAKLPDADEAIITDTSKVVNTLNSLCIEMDTRYDLLKNASCRNIKEYNKKFIERRLNPNKGHRYLPYIVLVIDELADLMMTAGKEIETPIARLAQLARAIGIHLIVATQRPSVNVITGIIKANFPARLSFRVTSKIDSRTILDTGGADQLIGMGDMLLSTGSDLTRLQCAFVDTPEVERICEFIGDQRGYDSAYMLPEYSNEEESGVGDVNLSERDALFADAARLIVMHQQGSTSLIQRKMKLGYNRAGRIIDQLEAAGIVGAFEGSKAREVLIPDEYSLEQLLQEIERNH